MGHGFGRTKKDAEQAAAKQALSKVAGNWYAKESIWIRLFESGKAYFKIY
jgi:hypothetical protein